MRRALLVAFALLAAGCLEGGGGPPAGDAVAVEWRTLARDRDSGMTEPQQAVVADEASWSAAWALHARSPNDKGPRPQVDFATERVVVLALGQKGSGCHDVRVENVTRVGDVLVVDFARYDGEAAGYSCTAALVQPVHFVAVRDRESEVRFEERVARPPEEWSADEPAPDPVGGEEEPLSLRPLDRGSFSGIHEDLRAVVRSPEAWAALWARHGKEGPAPPVEFPNESVIAVVERGPTGCFGVHVGSVRHDGSARTLVVEVVHERTPPETACIQALEDAYDFVAIPDRPGEARFVEVEGEAHAAGPEPVDEGQGDAADAPSFRTLDVGATSGVHEARRVVVTTEAAWRELWAEHVSTRAPPPDAPVVDFAAERVVAAFAGDKGNTCWALRVERVEEGPDHVTVEVGTYAPPPGAMCGFAVTQPFHLVALAAGGKPVAFVEVEREGPPTNV